MSRLARAAVAAARVACVAALLSGRIAGIGAEAQAAMIPGYSDDLTAFDSREVAMLPRYCIHTQGFRERVPGGNNLSEINRLHEVMGPTFEHMHHYCEGLMKTNRAMLLARNPQVKKFYLDDSIREFNYVIERAPTDFVMLPEILTKKGENLLRLGNASAGTRELEQVMELKPGYWPPYAVLSDYYKQQRDFAKAREVLEKGLAAAPDAQSLRRRLNELEKAKPSASAKSAGKQ